MDNKNLPKEEILDIDESGIMYRAGVKKYGKEGMRKIQSAAGKGASHQEIGKIKDKYVKDDADADAQMKIHPKVDSKKQRRVQCSFNIDKLIESGVEYEVKTIRLTVASKTRTFNK